MKAQFDFIPLMFNKSAGVFLDELAWKDLMAGVKCRLAPKRSFLDLFSEFRGDVWTKANSSKPQSLGLDEIYSQSLHQRFVRC